MKLIKFNSLTTVSMGVTTLIGLIAFLWPFFLQKESIFGNNSDNASILILIIVPLVLMVALADVMQGGIDSRSLAILGVLTAVVAAVRPLGAGVAGLEPVWAIIIIGGRALGASFGFVLGAIGILGSAVLTGGIGPWLPFQMLVAAWVGAGAGLLPKLTGKKEILLISAYGFIVGFFAGLLLNLWFWPFANGLLPEISFEPGLAVTEQLSRWIRFSLLTSFGYDLPRGILTAVLLFFLANPLLKAMRRMTKRANFSNAVVFKA
jgi:energy-coupling factor transport system substrate-specific component